MLTDKDLRIDNWVLLNGKPERVTAIDSQGINGSWGWEGMDYDFEFYLEYPAFTFTLEPIPLTSEILGKAGFEPLTRERYFETKSYANMSTGVILHNYLSEDENSINYIHEPNITREIKHVHQLQNLYFSLTGEELEISL